MRSDPTLRRLIPLTPLRHLYDRLRDFESRAFHREAARECVRRHDQVQELVAASVRHFELYDNRDEGFHDRGEGLTAARSENADLANRALALMARGEVGIPTHPELAFDLVDYDVSPIRTTGSVFEDGTSGRSSGRGGVDALLANGRDRLPMVGEIKADTDRNPFLGLIQSLTYAVELSTPSQRDRLRRAYPGQFAWPDVGPWVDVGLFLLRYPEDAGHAEFLRLVRDLVDRLTVPGSPFSQLVRRVVCFRTDMSSAEAVSYEVAFVTPAPPPESSG